ncbi:MAG: hypothetical protein CL885_00880 [Dehalococcoidia bacterium]|nr:hypothetical protein [Dehalococcoidia bacterium]|tara:strand:- start:38 stop:223 length:186 start_codon:yes stop_codon:yes gene_type:complete
MNLSSIARCAKASALMTKVKNGHYVNNNKFRNFGSVIEDSIFAQQKEADRRLALLRKGTKA